MNVDFRPFRRYPRNAISHDPGHFRSSDFGRRRSYAPCMIDCKRDPTSIRALDHELQPSQHERRFSRVPPAITPTPSAVQVAAPTAQSPVAATAGTTPPQEAEAQPGPACPLRVRRVGGREVCVGYQLGTCLSSTCPRAHVCHECGRRHPSGALCKGALRAVSRWIAAMSKDRNRR